MWISRDEYNVLKRSMEEIDVLKQTNTTLRKAEELVSERFSKVQKELYETKRELEHYLNTNEEKGVVYIPKFVIEKIVYDR